METDTGGRCPYCGHPRDTLLHVLTCDGQQGQVEADLEPAAPFALPTPAEAAAAGAGGRAQVDGAEDQEDEPFDRDGAAICFQVTLADGPQTGERLVIAAKNAGFVPHDDRAFGSIFLRLAREGIITKVGFERRMRGHGADGAVVWALVRTQ